MTAIKNYTWDQGADGEVDFIYSAGPANSAVPVNLTGYKLRMDIRNQEGEHIWTFNSDDIVETPPVDEVGDDDNEATLGSAGQISIVVPRALTLPDGAAYDQIVDGTTIFNYDIFLRDTNNKQKKILKGTITIEPSVTLWV